MGQKYEKTYNEGRTAVINAVFTQTQNDRCFPLVLQPSFLFARHSPSKLGLCTRLAKRWYCNLRFFSLGIVQASLSLHSLSETFHPLMLVLLWSDEWGFCLQ